MRTALRRRACNRYNGVDIRYLEKMLVTAGGMAIGIVRALDERPRAAAPMPAPSSVSRMKAIIAQQQRKEASRVANGRKRQRLARRRPGAPEARNGGGSRRSALKAL